ncbi:MAG TPA: hypothetical protein PL074_00985 [Thermoflexales bacterium]|nr:hypothetical protein [Thermoflexales bacterium]
MSDIPIFAWTFNDYLNTDPVGSLGCHMHDIKAHHINDESVRTWLTTYDKPVIPKFAGAYSKADTKTIIASWMLYFPTRVKYWLMPDEPTFNGISVQQMADMADAIREVSTIPIVMNLATGANSVPYIAAVKANINSVDAYCNGNNSCDWINTMRVSGAGYRGDSVLDAANWLKINCENAGLKREDGYSYGFVVQAFKQIRCKDQIAEKSTPFGDKLYSDYLGVFSEVFGSNLSLIGLYAWIADNDYDGEFPMAHSENWPTIKKFCSDAQGKGFDPIYPTSGGSVSNGVRVDSFTADKSTIAPGETTILRWTVANAASVSINQGVGTVTGNSHSISPSATTTYTITATGSDGKTATASVKITVGTSTPTTPTLDAPAVYYTNTTKTFTFSNLGGKSPTKVRAWFDKKDGSPYVTNRGVITFTSGNTTFSYASDDFVCDGGMFYVEFDNGATTGVFGFKQVARPTVTPTSVSGTVGQNKTLTLVASAGETIAAVSSSNTSVASVTKSGNVATVTILSAGTATITVTPQVVSGFNNSDFAIPVMVGADGQVSAITGTGVAIFTASAMCDLEI